MMTLNVSHCPKKAPGFRHLDEVLKSHAKNISKLLSDGHRWFFRHSNSVSVQHVFIKIEGIIS